MLSVSSALTPVISENEHNLLKTKKFHPYLSKMLREEDLKYVRDLDEDTFDPVLWKTLNQHGPAEYHWLIKDQLKPGYLWVQKDKYQKVAVHWTAQPGWIYRAYLSKTDSIIVKSFISHVINIQATKKEMTTEEFQKLIGAYLAKTPFKAEEPSLSLNPFQKRLELLPIVCKITRAACNELAKMRKTYSYSVLDVSLIIGAGKLPSESFNPLTDKGIKLITVSKDFFNGRLPFLHAKEKYPEETSEPVAPTIRSMKALNQIKKLRKMTLKEDDDKVNSEIFNFEKERIVSNLSSIDKETYENLKNKNVKDLSTWLVLVPGGFRFESYQFEKLESDKTHKKEMLELSIDFEETWKLKSKFFEKG